MSSRGTPCLYLDCFSGAAGDMLVGALLDLGPVSIEQLQEDLARLDLPGLEVRAEHRHQGALAGTHFSVHASGSQQHRGFAEIRHRIERSSLATEVKAAAIRVFRRLGEAEARVHDCPLEKVHFHEVGAADSIADIVGFCALHHRLGAPEIRCSPLPVGRGFVATEHGRLPVPAMATLELLKGVPIEASELNEELVTPTGAAILSTFVRHFGRDFDYTPRAIGYGLGTRVRVDPPNALRAVLCEVVDSNESEVMVLETNLDDATGQELARVIEQCLAAGALDAVVLPAVMKKGRPGHLVQVLAHPEKADDVERVLFSETPTLGVRRHRARRTLLSRHSMRVETPYGSVAAKRILEADGAVRIAVENDEIRRIAQDSGRSMREIARKIGRHLEEKASGAPAQE